MNPVNSPEFIASTIPTDGSSPNIAYGINWDKAPISPPITKTGIIYDIPVIICLLISFHFPFPFDWVGLDGVDFPTLFPPVVEAPELFITFFLIAILFPPQ